VTRAISENIFENQGSSWKFVDYGLIVEKDRGLNEKWLEYSLLNLGPSAFPKSTHSPRIYS
jgi:hypothetical protein